MKTLRVCLSSEFPPILERDKNYMYFLYDKLELFNGQNYYNDPYAIVATYPEESVSGMLYFCLDDGKVKARINSQITDIATIESEEQLEILKKCGTTFFINADRRYLDIHSRTITLPYRNGTYHLTADMMTDLVINENTVIRYNPETSEFVIDGSHQDHDMVFTHEYRGNETDSVKTTVDNNIITSEVKVNELYDNIIKNTPYGLYASVNDRVSSTVFNAWADKFREYTQDISQYIEELYELIERAEEIISSGTLSVMILNSLRQVYPEIDEALANYDHYANKIDSMEQEIGSVTRDVNTRINVIENTMDERMEKAINEPWGDFNYPV